MPYRFTSVSANLFAGGNANRGVMNILLFSNCIGLKRCIICKNIYIKSGSFLYHEMFPNSSKTCQNHFYAMNEVELND